MENKLEKKIDYKVWTREEIETMNETVIKENHPKSKPVIINYDDNDLLI